ncbi:MAG: hypothetical protein QOH83_1398 [Solirubrobacteraceae bacterium]|nr:hypothetical protein [Solirubrobacteraceae bacterium]
MRRGHRSLGALAAALLTAALAVAGCGSDGDSSAADRGEVVVSAALSSDPQAASARSAARSGRTSARRAMGWSMARA